MFNRKETHRLIVLASVPLKGKKRNLAGRIGLPFVCIYGTVPIEMESAEGFSFLQLLLVLLWLNLLICLKVLC